MLSAGSLSLNTVNFEDSIHKFKYFKLDVDIVEGVDELKSIHTLPSLLLYEDGALVHIVEDLPQKRPGKKLAAAIRQYLLHERGSEEQQSSKRAASAGQVQRSA